MKDADDFEGGWRYAVEDQIVVNRERTQSICQFCALATRLWKISKMTNDFIEPIGEPVCSSDAVFGDMQPDGRAINPSARQSLNLKRHRLF